MLFKVGLMIEDRLSQCYGLQREDGLWLAAVSSANKDAGVLRLDRLVRFDGLEHQHTPGSQFGDYFLNATIPKSLFDPDARLTELDGFEVIDDANIEVPIPGATSHPRQ